ncbi:putative Kyphoscoliosis peptidase [Hypsibius exemplaris]|uniref:Kyphoscoliosis peptidase n=1 Tax=Hypsibius exemplaris TaxID=2072580 RepID=A0A1W0X5V3_HYPEX|nr:putative Kyphoscoliosis peptidase [Hypsibius exemplaris]
MNHEMKCCRCERAVYPVDRIGPLKNLSHVFHRHCFKCSVCGSILTLKTYVTSQLNANDREVYCQNHVPKTGAGHIDSEAIGIKGLIVSRQHQQGEESNAHKMNGMGGHFDAGALHISHALNATELQKGYVKRANETPLYQFLDIEAQKALEMKLRKEEEEMYQVFMAERQQKELIINEEIKAEWEVALEELTSKFEKELNHKKKKVSPEEQKVLTVRHLKEKEDLEKFMTLKRDKKKESVTRKLLDVQRNTTADLIDKQSSQMMEFISAKRMEYVSKKKESKDGVEVEGDENRKLNGNGHSSKSGHHTNGDARNGSRGSTSPDADAIIYPLNPPPATPPVYGKSHIYKDPHVFSQVDQTAINVAQGDQKTFTDLIANLIGIASSDVEKARVIFRWITVKNLNAMEFDDNVNPDTPMGILRGIKHGTESYHVLFKRLCSYAGLHCVVIKGYSKSAGYQPGVSFDDNRFRNSWNAVYVDNAWRFVQCNWGARHLVNAKEAPKSNGSKGHSGKSAHGDSLRYEYDDHYFLTDPEEFIYEFYPLQSEWQLLRRPITLQEFEQLPFVRSLFFRYGLWFPDETTKAVIPTDPSGASTIRITMPLEITNRLIFHYNLKFYDKEGDSCPDGVLLKRFVMQSVIGNSVIFRVHAPLSGSYLLDIFANAVTPAEYLAGDPMKFKSVCKFRVDCKQLQTVMVPLPECASGEWGPAKATRLFGLTPLTHEDALIFASRELEIRFRMQRPLTDFMATWHKNGLEINVFQNTFNIWSREIWCRFILYSRKTDSMAWIFIRENGTKSSSSAGARNGSSSNAGEKQQFVTHCCKYLINVSRRH